MSRWWIAVVLMAVLAHAEAGNVYQWKDAQGRRHFGDQPPPGAQKADVRAPINITERTQQHLDAQKADAQTQQRAEKCRQTREQLVTYESAARIVQKDALGAERELSAAEKTKLIEITQRRVDALCAGIVEPPKNVIEPAAETPE